MFDKERKRVNVAVYGTLKNGHRNHRLMGANAVYLHTGWVRGTMWSLGSFPCFYPEGNDKVCVEVYEVDEETMLTSLDRLEGHYPNARDRSMYDRVMIDVYEGVDIINCAFIYTMKPRREYAELMKANDLDMVSW